MNCAALTTPLANHDRIGNRPAARHAFSWSRAIFGHKSELSRGAAVEIERVATRQTLAFAPCLRPIFERQRAVGDGHHNAALLINADSAAATRLRFQIGDATGDNQARAALNRLVGPRSRIEIAAVSEVSAAIFDPKNAPIGAAQRRQAAFLAHAQSHRVPAPVEVAAVDGNAPALMPQPTLSIEISARSDFDMGRRRAKRVNLHAVPPETALFEAVALIDPLSIAARAQSAHHPKNDGYGPAETQKSLHIALNADGIRCYFTTI